MSGFVGFLVGEGDYHTNLSEDWDLPKIWLSMISQMYAWGNIVFNGCGGVKF